MHHIYPEVYALRTPLPPLPEVESAYEISWRAYSAAKKDRITPDDLSFAGSYALRMININAGMEKYASVYPVSVESWQKNERKSSFLSREMVALRLLPIGWDGLADPDKRIDLGIDRRGWIRSRGRFLTRLFNRKRGYLLDKKGPDRADAPFLDTELPEPSLTV